MSGAKADDGNGAYLFVNTERRGAKRKAPEQPIAVQIEKRPEPRKKPQHDLCAQILADFQVPCSILDVSRTGVKILTTFHLAKGQEIGLHFLVPQTGSFKQVSILSSCTVVWSQSVDNRHFTAGLQLLPSTMSPNQHTAFIAFVDSLPEISQARQTT